MEINVSKINDNYKFTVNGASYIGEPRDNTVMFVTKKVEFLLKNLSNHRECLIFTEKNIDVCELYKKHNLFVMVSDPQKEYAVFVTEMSKSIFEFNRTRKYKLTKQGYTIGENVVIGENAYIEPGCFIDHDIIIGNNCVLRSGCIIRNAVIGDDFIANENAVIGAQGFTMAVNEQGDRFRIPSLGKVRIGNSVEIGVSDNISRGTGNDTIIEDNTKIDALVHIAHDVHIEKNVEVVAGSVVGGFANIGENAWLGINASIRNRIEIGPYSLIGMGAVVTKSVEKNEVVVGNPAKPFNKTS